MFFHSSIVSITLNQIFVRNSRLLLYICAIYVSVNDFDLLSLYIMPKEDVLGEVSILVVVTMSSSASEFSFSLFTCFPTNFIIFFFGFSSFFAARFVFCFIFPLTFLILCLVSLILCVLLSPFAFSFFQFSLASFTTTTC